MEQILKYNREIREYLGTEAERLAFSDLAQPGDRFFTYDETQMLAGYIYVNATDEWRIFETY